MTGPREDLSGRGPAEKLVAEVWREVLGVDDVAAHDGFVALGGDSILAMRVAAILRRHGIVVPVKDLLDGRTVAELARQPSQAGPAIVPVPRDRALPMSSAQQRLWFLDQFEPGRTEYTTPVAFRLRGPLDLRALRSALDALVVRHEPLRTTFDDETQRIGDPYPVPITLIDPDGLLEELGRPFDLRQGPLLRVSVVALGDEDHLLVLDQHHIITDGWSVAVITEELGTLYSAAVLGEPASLPPLAVQYADFTVWQRERVWDTQLTYWQQQLADLVALDLPTDHPRQATRTGSGAVHRFEVPAQLAKRLTEVARECGATMFTALAASIQVLLARHTGRRDIVLGTVNSGRNHPGLDRLTGFFVNTLLLRSQVDTTLSFSDFLTRVRATVLDAFANDEVPFDRVVDAVHPGRDAGRAELIQAMLVLQNESAPPRMAGLHVEDAGLPVRTAMFDLTWEFRPQDGGLAGTAEYDVSLFEPTTIARMVQHLLVLLAGITADPQLALAALPMLDAIEHDQLTQWNDTATDFPDSGMAELFTEQARQRPDAIALTFQGTELTYAELDARAEELAGRLGVTSGVVAVCLERGPSLIIALLAVLKAGAAYLPLDPGYPVERLAFMVTNAAPALTLTEPHLAGKVPGPVMCLDGERPATNRRVAGPRDLAYVMYTSGSTGGPKGVLVEHKSVVRLCRAPEIRPDTSDVLAHLSSISFDAATFEIWGALLNGATLAICPPGIPSIAELGDFLASSGVTTLWLTAGLFHEVVDADIGVLRGLRRLIAGGDVLSPAHCARVRRELPELALFNGYGPTEGTTFTTCHRIGQVDHTVPIGLPIAGTTCHVVDADMNLVPVGVPGELLIGGDGVARGYLNRPGLTAERFVAGESGGSRLYRSGDLVRRRDSGVLEFLGRLDDQVKIRGFRVELGEVAAAVLRHPGIAETVVVARSDTGHKRLVAYSVARSVPVADQELRAFLERILPGYLVPSVFVTLDRLPLTRNGKVDRHALPAPALRPSRSAPRTAAERTLCRVWSEVLGVPRVGVDDNFFDLGGDSIHSIQVVSRARAAGLLVTSKDIFRRQTVARLAPLVTAGQAAEQPSTAGPAPMTPIQHWFLETIKVQPERFHQRLSGELASDADENALRTAIAAVLARHDMLRMRFECVNGQWWQHLEADSHLDSSFSAVIEKGRLRLAAHHLAVDGVSWRIILAELQQAYHQARAGEPVDLGVRTTPYQDWARRLHDHAGAGGFDHELDYWTAVGKQVEDQLPTDFDGGNTVASQREVTVRLDASTTKALLSEVPATYRTQVNDVLLSALGVVLARWTGRPEVSIAVEGHGREDVLPGVDLSGTVGWFTTVFPVVLDIPGTGWGDVLKSVKEQVRAIPRRGFGYGVLRYLRRTLHTAEPSLSFNYLGQFDNAPSSLFSHAPSGIGLDRAAAGDREHLLGVTSTVTNGELEFVWSYSANRHEEGTIAGLAEQVLAALREIVTHCAEPGAGGATPSDFPLAGLDQAGVDLLVGDGRAVRDVYPLTPMQSGMLFHSLAEPGAGVYLERVRLVLGGVTDIDALEQAWHRTFDQSPELRTSLAWTAEGPLQVVRSDVTLPVTRDNDDTADIDLTSAPLMRLALTQVDAETVRLTWTFHHLLLDGWSLGTVLSEVLARYAGAEVAPRPPFADYLRWQSEQDGQAAGNYWRAALSGFGKVTPLPFDRSPRRAHRTTADAAVDVHMPLLGLQEFARRHRLTLNTVVQGMWAVLLYHHGEEPDVCFGAAVSGRPTDLPGAESMIGMFVNTIPVRVTVEHSHEVVPWLRALQESQMESRSFDHMSLAHMRSFTDLPTGTPLFDSIVVFENYPFDRDAFHGVTVTGIDVVEITNFPLNLVVTTGSELSLRLMYDPALFEASTVHRLADHLVRLLTDGVADPSRPLGDLPRTDSRTSKATAVARNAPGAMPDVAPRTAAERALAQIWERVLGVANPSVHNDFFTLGGDSILVLRLIAQIRVVLGADLSPRVVFDHPTIAKLAEILPAHGDAHSDTVEPIPRTAEPRLSYGQQRLWFLYNFAPHSPEYNSSLALRLRGELDIEALANALNMVVARHEVLRTTFADPGVPIVHPAGPVPLPVSNPGSLDRQLTQEATRPFDLRRGPVFRASLLRLSERDHVLHLAMHHIVSDGWSMGVLAGELFACYGGTPLPSLPMRYTDFAHWQATRGLDDGLAYWRRKLDGVQALELPADRPRPLVKTSSGAHERFEIRAALTDRLRSLGARHDTTLFSVLVAATKVVLARYSGQDDIAIGTAVAGRDRAELANLIGFFVNTVILRSTVDEKLSFSDAIATARKMILEAFDHAGTPFERVVEAIGVPRDTRRTPLVQVMVVLQNTPMPVLEAPGLRVDEVEVSTPTAQFDLTIEFIEREGGLIVGLRYNTDLFDAATITSLGGHLRDLLHAAESTPDIPLHRIVAPSQATVIEMFERAARRHPNLTAIRANGQSVSYAELADRAREHAAGLVQLGVRRGDRVCVMLPPGIQAVTSMVALAMIGAPYITVEPDVPPQRLASIVDGSGAVVVLTADTQVPEGGDLPEDRPGPGDPLCCVYTSGSTGRPKGVMVTNANVVNLVGWHDAAFGGVPGERTGQCASLAFDAPIWEIWSALCRGLCVSVAAPQLRRDSRALARWIIEEKLTLCFIPTVLAERIVAEGSLAHANRLRYVMAGGERLTKVPSEPMPFKLINGYGPAETTVWATAFDTTGWSGPPPPIGRAVQGAQVHLLDRYMRPAPVGVIGEVYIGGPGVSLGYWGSAERTAERFVADPFARTPGARLYRTGDLAKRAADGLIEFRGRADRQIKVDGVRVELDEVENVLGEHAAVVEAAVVEVAVLSTRGLHAYVTTSTAAEPGELREWLRKHFPETVIPRRITVLDAMPRTASGKTDRQALAERAEAMPEEAPPARPARTETERAVERHWAELLGRPAFDAREKFFDAGGSSMKLMDLRDRLERLCEREVPVALLFEHPTIEAMAQLVDDRRGASGPVRRSFDL